MSMGQLGLSNTESHFSTVPVPHPGSEPNWVGGVGGGLVLYFLSSSCNLTVRRSSSWRVNQPDPG
jgi:hypothetical protein